jgi:hypothetical protein
MTPIRQRLTYANVMSTLAFFVAIGGTTLAATKIDGATIEKGTIPGKAIKNSTIKAKKVKADTLTGGQIQEGSLGKVPSAGTADSATSATTAVSATTAGNAATVGGQSAGQLTDSCPGGTTPYAGVCIETTARSTTTWPNAAEICGDAGGRLPGLEELEGFRQEPGVGLGTEHSSSVYDTTEFTPGSGEYSIAISDNGDLWGGYIYGTSNAVYRCVFPLTNSG